MAYVRARFQSHNDSKTSAFLLAQSGGEGGDGPLHSCLAVTNKWSCLVSCSPVCRGRGNFYTEVLAILIPFKCGFERMRVLKIKVIPETPLGAWWDVDVAGGVSRKKAELDLVLGQVWGCQFRAHSWAYVIHLAKEHLLSSCYGPGEVLGIQK